MLAGSTASQLEERQGTSRVRARKNTASGRKAPRRTMGERDGHQWPEKSTCKGSIWQKRSGNRNGSPWLSAGIDEPPVSEAGGDQRMSKGRYQLGHTRQGALARGTVSTHTGNLYKQTPRQTAPV